MSRLRECSMLLVPADGDMHIACSPAGSRLAARTQLPRSPHPPEKIQPRKIWRDPTRKNWRGALRVLWLRLYANPSCASPFFPGWGVGDAIKKPRVRVGARLERRRRTEWVCHRFFFTFFLVWHFVYECLGRLNRWTVWLDYWTSTERR